MGAFIGPLIIAKLVEADQGLLFQYISLAIPMALFAVPYLFLPSPSPDLTYEPGATRSSKITQSPDELYKPLNSSTGDFTLDDEIESSPTMTAPVAPSSTPHEKRLVVEVVVLTAAFLFVYPLNQHLGKVEYSYSNFLVYFSDKSTFARAEYLQITNHQSVSLPFG